jgi:ABC-type polysaccharide/polyol phosphate export permease
MDRTNFNGSTYITGTSSVQGPFWAFTALQATVLAAGTVWGDLNGAPVAAMPIPAGVTVYGFIESIQLTSGSVIAYDR